MLTFAECFCAQHGIGPERYERAVFKRVLYRQARPVTWLLPLLNHDHFTAEYQLIKDVAHLTRLSDFAIEASRFHEHPCNRGILRRRFCMRISTTRLRTLIKTTFQHAGMGPDVSYRKGLGRSV